MNALELDRDAVEVEEIDAGRDHGIVIGPEKVRGGKYYMTSRRDGSILLTPIDAIPEEERAVWENPHLRQSLARGMAQAERGELLDWADVFPDDDK